MKNLAILIGNLGSDPEIRYTQGGTAVANFNMATTESWTKDGNKEERTEWHRVAVFGKLGEICGKYLTKGSKVYIEGKIQTRQWEDKDGNKRYTTEIIAREMKMLSPKNQGTQSGNYSQEEPPVAEPVIGDDIPF